MHLHLLSFTHVWKVKRITEAESTANLQNLYRINLIFHYGIPHNNIGINSITFPLSTSMFNTLCLCLSLAHSAFKSMVSTDSP